MHASRLSRRAVLAGTAATGALTTVAPLQGRAHAAEVTAAPSSEALWPLLAGIAEDAGVRPPLDHLPADVEAVRRGELLFLLHHGRDTVTVPVPGRHRDLLTGEDVFDAVELGRYGVVVLEAAP